MKRKRTSAAKVEAEEWEVEAVTDSRLKLEYTVRWNDGSVTIEPRENLIPGSEEAVNEFHRLHPGRPTLASINHVYQSEQTAQQLLDLRGQYGFLLAENQMLRAHRLPDAIQTTLFIPHQAVVLDENAQLKRYCQDLQDRINEANARAQHWKRQADALSATVDQQSQHMVAYVERQLAQNPHSVTHVTASAANTSSDASKQTAVQSQPPNTQLPAALTAVQRGSTASIDTLKDVVAHSVQEHPQVSDSSGGSRSITQPLSTTSIPLQSQTPITPAQPSTNSTLASESQTLYRTLKPSSTSSPIPRTDYRTLAEVKCHRCYHGQSRCSYASGVKCATCEKFGRICREVARNEDRSIAPPRATVRQQRLREARLMQAVQAKSQGDDSRAVVEVIQSADRAPKSTGTKDAPPEKPHIQLQEQKDENPTSLLTPERKTASGGVTEQPAQATPAEQTLPTTRMPGNGKSDWAAAAKVRCNACYHQGFECTYVPGQACYQCSRTVHRVCQPVITYNGVAPPPQNVMNAERAKERPLNANETPTTAAKSAPVVVTNSAPIPVDTLSSLQKEKQALTAEVRALRAAQEATEDIWIKQISLLEQALSKYSVVGDVSSEPLPTCRDCGGTESVGLREVPNGRLHLCHACGLQQARQGKKPKPHHNWEETKRLKAENIALSTEVAALKKRLAAVENAVVGWEAPPIDSGYDKNVVDLTAD